jgi:hypothetical protein
MIFLCIGGGVPFVSKSLVSGIIQRAVEALERISSRMFMWVGRAHLQICPSRRVFIYPGPFLAT